MGTILTVTLLIIIVKERKLDNLFDIVYADSDTPLFQAAKFVQEDYIIVTNKNTGETMEFKNQTEFWGHFKKKDKGWLSEVNRFLDLSFTPDDFTIEECARLKEGMDHLKEAEKSFDYFVGKLKRYPTDDYRLVMDGDSENFRKGIAQQVPYKGERKDKPLLFAEVTEMIKEKYKSKIILAYGEEADDVCGKLGWENFVHFKKTGKWKHMLAFVDKDLKMIISPYAIYSENGLEVYYPTPESCAKHFCSQMLSGDSTDNILGLPNFTEEIQEKYSLGKTRGIGESTALKLLNDCETIPDMFSRVAEAYKSYYGTRKKKFTSHTGEELKWSWKDYLRENSILLFMRRKDDEIYDIFATMDKMGVKY